MTPGFKGTLWIFLILGLWGVACKAKAEPEARLQEIIADKQVVYAGSCWFDAKGILTFKHDLMKKSVRCVVGMKMPDTTKHYVLIVGEKGPQELVMYDETAKKQETLWRGGKEA